MPKTLGRRTVLRGACGVALSLPLLEAMLTSESAAQQDTPRRILFEFKANGDDIDRRFTATGETDFQFDEFLQPLEPYRSELLILNKLKRPFNELDQKADNHQQGGSSLAPWNSGAGSFPIGGADTTIGYVEGPSADYELGERLLAAGVQVAHRHLVYRVGGRNNNIWNMHSHAGPIGAQNPIEPETDPYQAYSRIFNFAPEDAAAQAALRRKLMMQESALDLIAADAAGLRDRLAGGDRQKLEQHLSSLRDIERTLQTGNAGAGCAALTLGGEIDAYEDDNHAVIGDLFGRISAMALACDLTRVVNFNWSGNTSNRIYRNLGLDEGHHDISHKGEEDAFAKIRSVHQHLWTLSTNMYETLKSIPDGDGTVWDNTLVVHWNELGQGDSHTLNDSLVVFAGGAQGYFTRGRYLDLDNGRTFSDMLASCFHYMGFEDTVLFGDPRLGAGPVPGLTA